MDKVRAYKIENTGALIATGILIGIVSAIFPGTTFDIVLTAVAAFLIYIFSDAGEKYFLVKLFIWGLLIRTVLLLLLQAALIHKNILVSGYGASAAYLSPDAGYYTVRGWGLAQHIMGIELDKALLGHIYTVNAYTFYLYIVAFFHYLFGFSPVSVTFINCLFSVLTGIVYYFIGKEISGDRPARVAAIMIVFFPSLIIWSIENLKDPMFIFLTGIILLAFMKLIKTDRMRYWALLFAALLLQSLVRPKLIVLEAGIALWACFFYMQLKKKLRLKHLFIMIICAAMIWPVLGPKLDAFRNEIIRYHRGVAATAGFNYRIYDDWIYDTNVDYGRVSNFEFLSAASKGWAHFFLEPFPWNLRSALSIIVFPQMVIWYIILPFSVIGFFLKLKSHKRITVALSAFFLLVGTILAMTGGNIGTDFRIRDMLSPLVILFSAIGLVHFFRVKSDEKA